MAAVPPVSTAPSSLSSAPAVGPAPTAAAPVSSAAAASVTLPVTQVSASSSTRVTSSRSNVPSSSSSASNSHNTANGTAANIQQASNGGSHHNNSATIIAPIAAVACFLVILYIGYRLYLLHKRHKNKKETPLPPPRTPAIMEQRRPLSVYGQPPLTPGSPNPRPLSMIYGAGQSNHSISSDYTVTKSVHSSGHSTPIARSMDDSGRFTPLPTPSPRQTIANRPRPHSVASYNSARHSVYSMTPGSPLRGPPHTRGADLVLPQPLGQSASVPSRYSRYSMYNVPSYSELRRSIITPTATDSPSYRSLSRNEDWADRIAKVEDAQSASTCTAHQDSSGQNTQGGSGSSSPPSTSRSLSPPEPLLSSNAFADSTSGSTESGPPQATTHRQG